MCWLPYLVAFQNTPCRPGVPWLISIWPRNVWPSISWISYSNAKCRPRDKNTCLSATGNTLQCDGFFFNFYPLWNIMDVFPCQIKLPQWGMTILLFHVSQTTPFRPRPELQVGKKLEKNIAKVSLPASCPTGKLKPSPRPSVAGKRSPNYSSRLSHR